MPDDITTALGLHERPIRPAQNTARTRAVVQVSDLGQFAILSRAELESFTCQCGDPTCPGDLVGFAGCSHALLPGYVLKQGLVFMLCPRCRVGVCFRLAPDA